MFSFDRGHNLYILYNQPLRQGNKQSEIVSFVCYKQNGQTKKDDRMYMCCTEIIRDILSLSSTET